jgi:hypothetical protein
MLLQCIFQKANQICAKDKELVQVGKFWRCKREAIDDEACRKKEHPRTCRAEAISHRTIFDSSRLPQQWEEAQTRRFRTLAEVDRGVEENIVTLFVERLGDADHRVTMTCQGGS